MRTIDDDLRGVLGGLKDEAPEALVERLLADAAIEVARRQRPAPSEPLMARIAADARWLARRRRRQGWGALGGLVAACIAGLAVGLSDPGGLIGARLAAETADGTLSGAYDFQIADLGE
jgi:hypothetical protein